LKRVAAEALGAAVTVKLYRSLGRFSEKPFRVHFGTWPAALEAAGLSVSAHYHERSADEQLLENLESVWQALGRQPTVNDMSPPLSRFSAHVYKRRFGGFRRALEAFVESVNDPSAESVANSIEPRPTGKDLVDGGDGTVSSPVPPRGSRTVGWRLRYVVLQRDRFRCCACGRSPAQNPGAVLEVDHVVAWSCGGLTTVDNLQTLCDQCNGGKGAG
jgi:hypothetical protein